MAPPWPDAPVVPSRPLDVDRTSVLPGAAVGETAVHPAPWGVPSGASSAPPQGSAGSSAPVPPGGPEQPWTAAGETAAQPASSEDGPTPSGRRWPKVLAVVGGAVLLVAGGYVGAAYALADRVPRGATVAGVAVGGMSVAQAEQALADGLADARTRAVAVVAGGERSSIEPVEAGLSFDASATLATMTGVRLGEPGRVWNHVVGVGAVTPLSKIDQPRMKAAVDELAATVLQDPVDGSVVFDDGVPQTTRAVDGVALDTKAAAATISAQWLTADGPLELDTVVVTPRITQEAADRALVEQARPLVAGDVRVTVEGRSAVLSAEQLASAAGFDVVGDSLSLTLDGAALRDQIVDQIPNLLTRATDARFVFGADGKPVVQPGTAGTTIDPEVLASAVVASTTADRVVTAALVESDPTESVQALEALGITELVSSFSTDLNSEPRRTQNITRGANIISGTLVRPGETFSLGATLSPINGANGFVEAGVISGGFHKDGMGGGLSQLSTTAFNAAYEAGMEIVTFKPHSEWFARYPAGRESTLAYPTIDMKWTNNTPYGALVRAWVSGGKVHVQIWGTKHWTIESIESRSNVQSPGTVYNASHDCKPQNAQNPGFVSTVTRRVYLDGKLQEERTWTHPYRPQHRVICGSPG